MNCPAKSEKVVVALCELFYPYGCGAQCKHLYDKWMATEPEVQQLESEVQNGL